VKKVFSHPGRQIIYNISSAGCKPAAELKKRETAAENDGSVMQLSPKQETVHADTFEHSGMS